MLQIRKCHLPNGVFVGYYIQIDGVTATGVESSARKAYKKYRSLERQGIRNMNLLFPEE